MNTIKQSLTIALSICLLTVIEVTVQAQSTISGNIATPNNKKVTGVSVVAISNDSTSSLTSSTGDYTLSLTNGKSYTVTPYKNNTIVKSNGVTSIDIVLIQNHILGKTILNSPYKIIAADVNGDGKVTARDMVNIKRLILGIDTTFKNSTTGQLRLWSFVDSDYQFADATNPFSFSSSKTYSILNATQTNQNFIAIKLGDVNLDWNSLVQ